MKTASDVNGGTATPATLPTSELGFPDDEINSGDIAVIGLGCRVAGGINSPEQLWDFLLAKGDASGDIPPMRWEPYYSHDARNVKTLKALPSRGYFLKNLEEFDAAFFGTSGREAELMDPQQRISVEVTWEALEDAGIPPQSLVGSDTAVYMGVGTDDYSRLLFENLADIEAWTGIGTAYCGVPNRISYLLDLNGPSFAVDAACASSLVAIHHARQALLSGETSIAIAGGVNALIVPGQFQVLSHAGAISPEGQCMSFDDDAHGYGRGEGVGIVILKRLEDAVRDGDHIQAVLKGSAIGHDGRTNGIMAPNGKAQIQVARDALRAANLEASSISYVEAHATSTPAGDPVETSAISTVYGHGRPESEPCLVGSIKPNIGHLESGAGALGFIKSVLAVNKSFIPPQTNLKKLNSKIDWKTAGIEVVREQREWKQDDKPRRAAICSYGYGGTVSHAIIENAPLSISSEGSVKSASSIITDPVLLLLSAPQAPRLPIAARTLGEWFSTETGSAVPLDVVGNTLALRRGHHAHRVAVVTSNAEEASKLLKSLAEGSPNSDAVATARISPEAANPGPVWVFSGHGAHWKGMGVELMEQDPVFAKTIYDIDTIVQKELDFSVATILKDGSLGTTDVVHVLTFAMQVGLSAVLKSKGVFPSAIIGHSLGETAAAVCAGALTLREATLIVSKKAKLLQKVMGTGAMVLLQIPFEEAVADVGSAEGIAVAIDTSPNSCVVSGEIDVVERFSAAWKERGVNVRKVNSDIAFHSPMLHCLRQQFQDQIEAEIKPQTPTIPLYSTSIPNDPRSQAPRDGKYWADNLINPVLLTSAITAAADDGFRVFLEVSSHPIVCQGIDETLDSCGVEGSVVLPTLLRNRPPRRSVLLCVGKLHCNGVSVDLASIFGGEWSQSVPKTQWKHEAFWKKVAPRKSNQETHDVESHTLLGQRTQLFGTNLTLWQTFLDDTVRPYPNLHPIMGTEIIPAAVLLSTFLKAGETTSIGDIKLKAPVPVMPPRDIQIKLDKDKVQISSRLAVSEDPESQPWTTHTLGQILAAEIAIPEKISIEEIKQKTKKTLVPTFAVDYLASLGVTDMGFPWVVTEHLAADNEMLVRVAIAPDVETLPWNSDSLAPFIDAATSVGAAIFHEQPGIRMPSHIDRVSHLPGVAVPREGYIHVKRTSIPLTVDITMSDMEGNVFAEVAAMTLSELEGTEGVSSSMESLVHEVAWPAAPLTDFPAAIDHIIFIGPGKNIIKGYREFLEATTKIKVTELAGPELIRTVEHYEGAVIIFIPAEIESDDQVFQSSSDSCAMLVAATKIVASLLSPVKLYAITQNAAKGATPTALAQGALYGLARIIETEHANIWGALIDVEDSTFPLQAIKYVTGADIIRVVDGVARIGRLRSLPKAKLYGSKPKPITLPTTDGTYVITGGTGDLGLEVASWMIEKGARRLVLVSRRKLPARRLWASQPTKVTEKVLQFEKEGATVHVVSLDISASDAASKLLLALEQLSLPPVKGVVHAAGVLEDQFLMTSDRGAFDRVLAPKIKGAMSLNEAFPPNTLDFFVLFSSCGQHFQFAGSASYASGNSFLDSLAKRRRDLGDNTIAFQWTCWRNLGMAADADNLNAEMEIKGITDVTSEDAFKAWEYFTNWDMESAVIVRARPIAQGAILASPILADIVVRHAAPSSSSSGAPATATPAQGLPTSGPELSAYLSTVICSCVAKTLKINEEDIDPSVALSELGLDSVMTIQLRKHLQDALNVKVPPTLIWSHPSVGHIVKWFVGELAK